MGRSKRFQLVAGQRRRRLAAGMGLSLAVHDQQLDLLGRDGAVLTT